MDKCVLIAVGGSGGHIYPAVSFAQKLREQHKNISIVFIGGGLKSSPFFDRNLFLYHQISCASFSLKKPLTLFKSFYKILLGFFKSRSVIKKNRPAVVVGFGSYHSLPSLIAAKIENIPIILHEGNAIPGRVNRFFSKYAMMTAIYFPEAANYIDGKCTKVCMPLREGVFKGSVTKEEALAAYGFTPDKKTLFVFGGSQGALALNRLMLGVVENLDVNSFQILHLTGSEKESALVSDKYKSLGIKAHVKPYEEKIEQGWTVAHLFIGRSGASTIAEALEFEVPCLFIPYPFSTEQHQIKNAEFMQRLGGAGYYEESKADASLLAKEIANFFKDQSSKLEAMRQAIKYYKSGIVQYDMSSLVSEVVPLRSMS